MKKLKKQQEILFTINPKLKNEEKTIYLPQLLDFYNKDFGKTPEKSLKTLQNYMSSGLKSAIANSYQIKYKEFQWYCNYTFKHLE